MLRFERMACVPQILSGTRKRFMAGCSKQGKSKCPKLNKELPCGLPKDQAPKKSKPVKFKSMWLNPFCDPDDTHCPFNPRFDDIYYVESDKAKRKYWQTWVSCPPLKIKKKKICCFEKTKPAPIKRRKRSKKISECPQECQDFQPGDCKKLVRRCHRRGRIPPSCTPTRAPGACVKPLTPYPSFSECKRLKPDALPMRECGCLTKPMLCEVWALFRKQNLAKSKKQMTD